MTKRERPIDKDDLFCSESLSESLPLGNITNAPKRKNTNQQEVLPEEPVKKKHIPAPIQEFIAKHQISEDDFTVHYKGTPGTPSKISSKPFTTVKTKPIDENDKENCH